jgi:dGTPase
MWTKLQAGKLHIDGRVVAANLQAARIVAELTTTYALIPDLVDSAYRLEYQRLKDSRYLAAYRKRVGSRERVEFRPELLSFLPIYLLVGSTVEPGKDIEIPVDDLVMAKDYVASLSDSRARKLHSDIFNS